MISITDILRILDWLNYLYGRIEEYYRRQEDRRKMKDEIFKALMMLMDFVVDGWLSLKPQKAVEGGYDEDMDSIEDTLDEMRSLLSEAYRAASMDNLARALEKVESFERERRALIRKLRRLKRKQRERLRELLQQLREEAEEASAASD